MLDLVKQGLDESFKPIGAAGGVVLPGQKKKATLAPEDKLEHDKHVLDKEKKKVQPQKMVWATDTAALRSTLGGLSSAVSEDITKTFDQRHAMESLSFQEFVTALKAVEDGDFQSRVFWSFLIFEDNLEMLPGRIIKLGKTVVPEMNELLERDSEPDVSVDVIV